MSHQGLVWTKASSVDYLADRLLASYFEAREHESYYNSLKHVDTRRDFHETIIPVLIDFIGEALSNLNDLSPRCGHRGFGDSPESHPTDA